MTSSRGSVGGIRVEGPTGVFVGADLPGPQGRVALAVLVLERVLSPTTGWRT